MVGPSPLRGGRFLVDIKPKPVTIIFVMKTVVEINWKLREIFGKGKSFEDWYKEVFDSPAPKKLLTMIKNRDKIQTAKGEAVA